MKTHPIYEMYRKQPPAHPIFEWKMYCKQPPTSDVQAYWDGYEGRPCKVPRTSSGWCAYKAGKDNCKAHTKLSKAIARRLGLDKALKEYESGRIPTMPRRPMVVEAWLNHSRTPVITERLVDGRTRRVARSQRTGETREQEQARMRELYGERWKGFRKEQQ
jgi:hypothetical protein